MRDRYIKASSEIERQLIPVLEHFYAGFDDIGMGLLKDKLHLAEDSRKHFKRGGIESMEFLALYKRKEISKMIEECKEYKIQDIETKGMLVELIKMEKRLIELISKMRGVKSDMSENETNHIDISSFQTLMNSTDEFLNDFDELELNFITKHKRYQEIKEEKTKREKNKRIRNIIIFLVSIVAEYFIVTYFLNPLFLD